MMREIEPESAECAIPILVDYALWGYRRQKAEKMEEKFPHHKTRSVFY